MAILGVFWLLMPGTGKSVAHDILGVLLGGHLVFLDLFFALGTVISVMATIAYLQQMWTSTHAELPLLALLPGLGDVKQARSKLLHAVLARPLAKLATFWLALLALARIAHIGPAATVLLAIIPPVCAAVLVVCTLGILGGSSRTSLRLITWGIYPVLCIATCLSVCLPILLFTQMSAPQAWHATQWLGLSWLVIVAVLCVMACHHRRCFRQQPHPFLASV